MGGRVEMFGYRKAIPRNRRAIALMFKGHCSWTNVLKSVHLIDQMILAWKTNKSGCVTVG